VYDPLLCLLGKSGKGVQLKDLVADKAALRKIHPNLRPTLDGMTVFGGAYADDITLTASNRADLQSLADICNDWFEAHGIETNPAKSIHLSYDPVSNQPTSGELIQMGKGTSRASIRRLQPLSEPLRILGMYIVPDGRHAPIYQMCKELASTQAKMLRSRAMTDKIALFVVRAVMIPALSYKMQGHAFTEKEIQQISKPLLQALKHVCSLPTTFPSSILHHRLAGKVPRLTTVHTGNNLTLLTRAMNAPTPLNEIIHTRIAATEHYARFPGPMLEIPWHVLPYHRSLDCKRRLLIPSMASILH
jgi:Reverse transcriptase (RNA-dependent DNA polymerase)